MFSDIGSTVIEIACWAHTRSRFFKAVGSYPRESHQVLEWIRQLYDIEDRAHDSPVDARRELRVREAIPVLDRIETYLAELAPRTLPKSSLGKAVLYSPSDLIRFMESPYASWMQRLHVEHPELTTTFTLDASTRPSQKSSSTTSRLIISSEVVLVGLSSKDGT
ncbi:Transposase IS66 family protein [Gimesia algae]|uniref:Transposase IS66 family protein n=2 Tax=Gimesia algae TaxID=2527971 RepID=A0A517VEW5_9PLAN|nr:Transposase IS66 family protein [Gimesia algae]